MMTTMQLESKAHRQPERVPAMYGAIDFSIVPERFTEALGDTSTLPARFRARRAKLLANRERVALMRAYTMVGDAVADAYAALLPHYGARRLIGMLRDACAKGVDR